jgi:hypothetical protein
MLVQHSLKSLYTKEAAPDSLSMRHCLASHPRHTYTFLRSQVMNVKLLTAKILFWVSLGRACHEWVDPVPWLSTYVYPMSIFPAQNCRAPKSQVETLPSNTNERPTPRGQTTICKREEPRLPHFRREAQQDSTSRKQVQTQSPTRFDLQRHEREREAINLYSIKNDSLVHRSRQE